MKLHRFRIFIEVTTTFLKRFTMSDLYIYGYERHPDWTRMDSPNNDTRIRLLSALSGPSAQNHYVGIGLLRRLDNVTTRSEHAAMGRSLLGGLELLYLTDVRMQIFDTTASGPRPNIDYLIHVRGLRQKGLRDANDLSLSCRIIGAENRNSPESNPTSVTATVGTAELLLFSMPTVFGSQFQGGPTDMRITIQLSANVTVERELYPTPLSLIWCIYQLDSPDFHEPASVPKTSGRAWFYKYEPPDFGVRLFVTE
jgi:hypothetical protein